MTEFYQQLNTFCREILQKAPPPDGKIKIAICGACGCGKSTLGKKIRKQGFGDFKPYQIAVIDDCVMSLNLFIIRPKIKAPPPAEVDNLKPFLRFLPRYVKLVFCIGSSIRRIEFADILVRITCEEQARLERLNKREKDSKRIQSLMNAKPTMEHLTYTYELALDLS